MKRVVLGIILALASFCTFAGIDKIAETTDSGIRFMWWPKAEPPKG